VVIVLNLKDITRTSAVLIGSATAGFQRQAYNRPTSRLSPNVNRP
jgi:hypothetical protein